MNRLRLLAWLLTLAALIAPPGWSKPATAMATTPSMSTGCADHVPATPPCPDEGTAKHAAAACCPAMAGAMALLPQAVPMPAMTTVPGPVPWSAPMLHGRNPAADLPPPRS